MTSEIDRVHDKVTRKHFGFQRNTSFVNRDVRPGCITLRCFLKRSPEAEVVVLKVSNTGT